MEERIISQGSVQKFLVYLTREEKSTATKEKYLRDVRAFSLFANGRPVNKELVIEYKQACCERGYAARSINSMLASINSFLSFAGWGDCKVRNLRIQQQTFCEEEKELTKGEYLRLLKVARSNEQLYLVLQTICGTGIRVSELEYFTVESVRCGKIMVHCKNKTRTIFVPGKLKKALLRYADSNHITCGVIFTNRNGKPMGRSSIWRQMKHLCESAGVKKTKVFPHNLRKLFAHTFYSTDKDIAKLADILGHSSINTTRIYIISSGVEHRMKIEQLGLIV